jgi:SAM-dependent methyltransferase
MIILVIIGVILLLFGLVVIKGAPYVPTHVSEIEQAFDKLYKLNSRDTLVDIGSGDGIVLRHAAKRGAKAIGYEINPILVIMSQLLAFRNPLVRTELADFWRKELPRETTVVYIFSVSRDAHKLARKMQQESNRLAKPLPLITYGAVLKDKSATKKHRGHHLYMFTPLQETQA